MMIFVNYMSWFFMSKKMAICIGIFLVFCTISLVYFLFLDSDMDVKRRTRDHFNVPRLSPVSPKTVRSTILTELPLKSHLSSVISFLEKGGLVVTDQKGFYLPQKSRSKCMLLANQLLCYIPFSHEKVNFKFSRLGGYRIKLFFDNQKQLKEVEVEEDWVFL
ncbi:hypothetical protein IQ249_05050 [Lusitaniella coriacea LEGE 07157]|uniref:Uncharacterized protein n=1 Tax=Lusitaniella coriacea LEGE 07157 TaxID=945747 RepID=A0A8J7B7B6_9CYAN|nr:hypothetical protein [Lusitaniella coriacea]MBE9115264.1 hypothetical protein [Lusitaniella coriacea LEGE 07157]